MFVINPARFFVQGFLFYDIIVIKKQEANLLCIKLLTKPTL
jgi:hypothetical protein